MPLLWGGRDESKEKLTVTQDTTTSWSMHLFLKLSWLHSHLTITWSELPLLTYRSWKETSSPCHDLEV